MLILTNVESRQWGCMECHTPLFKSDSQIPDSGKKQEEKSIMKKKVVSLLAVMALAVSTLAGCGSSNY